MGTGESCAGYLDYPFQYMCSDEELYPNLSLSIHRTGKVFHIAHLPLMLERISQVASTGTRISMDCYIPLSPPAFHHLLILNSHRLPPENREFLCRLLRQFLCAPLLQFLQGQAIQKDEEEETDCPFQVTDQDVA
jgi:hypothetical protein